MKAIAIIPARGGSKRIPGKNIIDFRGCPMIAWTIQAALKSGIFYNPPKTQICLFCKISFWTLATFTLSTMDNVLNEIGWSYIFQSFSFFY